MTISTLVGQHLQGRTASNDLRADVYKDQHGTSFRTCEHLRTYRLRPLEAAVPEVCWKDDATVNGLIRGITSDREDTLVEKIADRIAEHHGLSSLKVSSNGTGQYSLHHNESEHTIHVCIDHASGRRYGVAVIEDADELDDSNTESITQESLWALQDPTSSDLNSPIEASLESQHLIFVRDSELYFRINIYRSLAEDKLFATGETQDTYQLYTPHMDRNSAPIQARLWVSTPAESLIHDLSSDSTDELVEVFKARVERQSLLPISRTLIRESQYLIRDLVGSDSQKHDLRINVYRDLANNEHSVAVEEKQTVILSPEDYEDHTEDEKPTATISNIWIPNDTMLLAIEDIHAEDREIVAKNVIALAGI